MRGRGRGQNIGLTKCQCLICQRLNGFEHGIHYWRREGIDHPFPGGFPTSFTRFIGAISVPRIGGKYSGAEISVTLRSGLGDIW
jgi:hypothetical protein